MSQKFHITESGPKPCKARTGKCPYAESDHFSTKSEGTFRQDYIAFHNKKLKDDYFAQKEKFLDPFNTTSLKVRAERGDVVANRHLVKEIENKENSVGELTFVNYSRDFSFLSPKSLGLDPSKAVTMKLARSFETSDAALEVIPVWTVTLSHPSDKYKPEQELKFRLRNEHDRRVMELKIHEFARLGASKMFPDEKNTQFNQEYMSDKIISTIHSVENENHSAKKVKEMGLSFFKNEDQKIIVNQNYDSTFRPKHIKERLRLSPYYPEKPETKIRLWDSEAGVSSNWWSINVEDGEYSIMTNTRDEPRKKTVISSPEQARDIVKNFTQNVMLSQTPELVKEKSEFAFNFISETQKVFKEHEERIKSEKNNKREIDNELYDRDAEEKSGSLVGKLFKLLG